MLDKETFENLKTEANVLHENISLLFKEFFDARPNETDDQKSLNSVIVSAVVKSIYFQCLFSLFSNEGNKNEYRQIMNHDFEKFWDEHKIHQDFKKL